LRNVPSDEFSSERHTGQLGEVRGLTWPEKTLMQLGEGRRKSGSPSMVVVSPIATTA